MSKITPITSMPATLVPDRAARLDGIQLDSGSHNTFDDGHCAMEVVAWLAGEGHTDAPACASAVLRRFTIGVNDRWDDTRRQRLVPFLPRMVGTAGDGKDEARSYLALDWLIRTFTPAWLDLAGLSESAAELRGLRQIADLAAVRAAGPVVWDIKRKAAAAAAGDATWAATWAAARGAAAAAARGAARDAARGAAGDAAKDAGDAAAAAAAAATWAATWDALRPTVDTLQASALDLLDRMIDPAVTR